MKWTPKEEEKDGDDPSDTPPPEIYGEEIDSKIKCCPKTFEVPANRSGNKVTRPRPGRRKAGEEFDMLATFTDGNGGCKCKCCEYRQYVKGTFKYRGRTLRHMLPSGPLDPNDFKEDGIPAGPPGPHFGHRDETGAADDRYLPNRADGCEYKGNDFPSLTGRAGTRFSIDLTFKGEILDVCNNKVLETNTWTVKFSGRLSRRKKYWD